MPTGFNASAMIRMCFTHTYENICWYEDMWTCRSKNIMWECLTEFIKNSYYTVEQHINIPKMSRKNTSRLHNG